MIKEEKYSVKSSYKVFMNSKIETSSSVNPMESVWENLWKLKVPPKIKHLCMMALNDMTPTKFDLKNRGIDTFIECPISLNDIESSYHSFFGCPRDKEIWRLIPLIRSSWRKTSIIAWWTDG